MCHNDLVFLHPFYQNFVLGIFFELSEYLVKRDLIKCYQTQKLIVYSSFLDCLGALMSLVRTYLAYIVSYLL